MAGTMLCPYCGTQIVDDAATCPRCRARLTSANMGLAATDVAKDLPEQERKVRVLAAALLALVTAFAGWMLVRPVRPARRAADIVPTTAVDQRITILQNPVVLKTGAMVFLPFAVPAGCHTATMEARFDAGTDAGVGAPQMTIFDEAAFTSWKARRASHAQYSARVKPGTVEVALPAVPQRYVLVFTSGGAATPTTLQGSAELICARGAG
jgi:hypothetical protein